MNSVKTSDFSRKVLEIIKPSGYSSIKNFAEALENQKIGVKAKTARIYFFWLGMGNNRLIPERFKKSILSSPLLNKKQKSEFYRLFNEDKEQKNLKVCF